MPLVISKRPIIKTEIYSFAPIAVSIFSKEAEIHEKKQIKAHIFSIGITLSVTALGISDREKHVFVSKKGDC